MKNLHTLLFIFILTLSSHAVEISGHVINATRDSSTVAASQLFLQQVAANAQAPTQIAETESNRNGAFRFSLEKVDLTSTYYVSTDFQGVRYFTEGLTLRNGQTVSTKLIVNDSTHSTAGVDAFMHHIIIDDIGGALQFRETHVLNNPGAKTITQSLRDETVGPALFKFQLPAGAVHFSPISAHTPQEMIQEGQFVFDRSIFLPGKKTISYGYEMPLSNKQAHIKIVPSHAARTFDIFVGSKNISIESAQLEDYDMFSISGTQYHRYGASNVEAGQEIVFTVTRKGISMPAQSPTVAIIASSALLLIGLFLSLGKKQSPKGQKETETGAAEKRRRELIEQIAALDTAGKHGAKSQRQKLMNELQTIELKRLNASKKPRRKK